MTEHVLAGLLKRRAEMDGEAIRLRVRLQEIELALPRLDAAIQVFAPATDPTGIRPIRYRAPNLVGFSHWSRAALDVLREAGEALPTKEVVARVMDRVSADRENGPVRRMVTRRVGHALQHQRTRGLVLSEKGTGQVVTWSVAAVKDF